MRPITCGARARAEYRVRLHQYLLDKMHSDPELVDAYSELAECARDRATRLRGVADALETTNMRLKLALCDAGRAGAA